MTDNSLNVYEVEDSEGKKYEMLVDEDPNGDPWGFPLNNNLPGMLKLRRVTVVKYVCDQI